MKRLYETNNTCCCYSKAQKEHLILLTNQLLAREGLSCKKWSDLILSLSKHVTQVVKPDVKTEGDEMDIRKYIQIKKVSHWRIVVSKLQFQNQKWMKYFQCRQTVIELCIIIIISSYLNILVK